MDRNLMFLSPHNNLNLVESLGSQSMSPELQSDSSYRCEDGGGDASASLLGEEENHASGSSPAEGQTKVTVDMGRNVSVVNPVMHTPAEGAASMVSRSFGRMPYLGVVQHATRSCPFIRVGHEEYVLQPDTIFVLGMRQSITKNDIIVCFGQIGHIKVDEGTHKPKIFVYKDKLTGRSKGEATVTFASPLSAQAAIAAMSGRRFMGHTLTVLPAYRSTRWGTVRFSYPRDSAMEREEARSQKWRPASDNWSCLVCRNSNFVWRSACNRCLADKGTAPGSGLLGNFSRRRPHNNDWLCDGCNNVNFWYRKRCNLCNSAKQRTETNGETDTLAPPMEPEKWDLVLQSSAENVLSSQGIPMEVEC